MDHEEELRNLRRRNDELFSSQLHSCKLAIDEVEKSVLNLRDTMGTQLMAISIQIAKIPVPMSLQDMQEIFVTRKESDKVDKLINTLVETFITKDEIRPLKAAIYTIWGSIGAGLVTIFIRYVLK